MKNYEWDVQKTKETGKRNFQNGNKYRTGRNKEKQTETDRNRHAFRIGHCAWDHAKNTSLMKDLEIESD